MEKQLAFNFIKSRKKKNIIAVITIALVMAFLTAICIYGYSYSTMEKRFFKAYNGTYHGVIPNLKSEELNKLEKHADVEKVSEVIDVKDEITEAANIHYRYYSKKALEEYSFSVTEGKYPETIDEVAIDKLYGDKFNKKMGDSLTVDGKDFKIVGVIDNKEYTRELKYSNFFEVFMSKRYGESVCGKINALVTLKSVSNYEETFKGLANLVGANIDNVFYNETQIYVEQQGVGVLGIFILIGSLVAFSAFFIIYNIFHIALGERIKSIGLLLTIGVTSKQIRKMVLIEAIILSLMAIPFGVGVGFLGSKIMIENIHLNTEIRFLVHPILLPLAILLTLLTVIISVIKPAFKISKLSPIEASKYVQRDEIKGKKRKEGKNFFTDFAKANQLRNKKVNRVTRISLVLSIILFMVASSIFRSMGIEHLIKQVLAADVQIDLEWRAIYEGNFIKGDILNKIKNVDGAETTVGYKGVVIEKNEDGADILVGINEEELKKLKSTIVEGQINDEAFKNGDEVVTPIMHKDTEFKVGDEIEVQLKDGNTKKVKVSAIVSETVSNIHVSQNILFGWNEGSMLKDIDEYVMILVDTKEGKSKEVSKRIEGITSNYKNIDPPKNYEDTYEGLMKEKRSIVMIGYVIVFVVALIGIMNFINSTLAGILSRRKEIGMLRAVGITDGEIKKILIWEGLYGVGISLGFGIVFGNILAAIAVYLFKNFIGATYAIYTFPILETILCIIVIVLLLVIVTKSVINKITKDSVVEQIRYED